MFMSFYFLIHFISINYYKYTHILPLSLRITRRTGLSLMLSLLLQFLEMFLSSLGRSVNDFLLET